MDNSLSEIKVKELIPDAGVKKYVRDFIAKTESEEFSNVFTLDLSDCPMDYPATALLIDHVVNKVQASLATPRSLRIQTNFTLTMDKLVLWLFRGSETLGLHPDISSTDVETQISQACRKLGLELKVSIESRYLSEEATFK